MFHYNNGGNGVFKNRHTLNMNIKSMVFLSCLSFLSTPAVLASAPVVDESDHYSNQDSEMQPLAHEDNQSMGFEREHSSVDGNQMAKLFNQIQDLQQTVQELRGQLDTQRQTIDALKEQQLTLYKDLDSRITGSSKTLSKKPVDMKTPINPTTQVSKKLSHNPADEQISYMAAYHLIEKKQFTKAQLALQEFIQNYPTSTYTSNAEYWLGELSFQQKDYAQAMAHFENVINNFPSSNKMPASLYKLGASLAANGQTQEARGRFNELMQKYPDSDAANLAANKLKVL